MRLSLCAFKPAMTVALPRTVARTAHTYSADPSVGPMLRFERSLPRLPVPTVASTAAKYLESVRPHLIPAEDAATTRAVDSFTRSPLVGELQARLTARAAEPGMANWLAAWWDDVAYMAYRDPVVVYVSYFYIHRDAVQRQPMASRAAHLLKGMMAFRELVETCGTCFLRVTSLIARSQQLEPDKVRDVPLSMASLKWLFHACRYPVKPSDMAHKFDPRTHNHVVFVRKNKFYEVQLARPDGSAISVPELDVQIEQVLQLAGTEKALPVGVLTSDNRDNWADARAVLARSPANQRVLERIESAMILVCLDDTSPVAREETSWACWTGDGRNRFYDKHQLIIFENGRSGFTGEHSCMDGTTTLRMNEFILGALAAGKIPPGESLGTPLPPPVELQFEVDDSIRALVHASERRFDALIAKHDLEVLHYDRYGKALVKTFKISPDAWAQMAMQLAFHKFRGRPGVCYESCQTRKFALGRTEVIRSASAESRAWAQSMLDPHASDATRAELLRRANVRHAQYAAWAADGQGVDRHLFGLKRMLREGEQLPALYEDKAFAQTNHWELSTSQLSSDFIDGWGYGEVVEDGYGLAYAIGDDYFRWTITSLKLDTAGLKRCLEEALDDMRSMMERVAQDGSAVKPKL